MTDRTHELVLCCQGVIYQFVRNVAMNRSIYSHAECFMRRFKLKISASGIYIFFSVNISFLFTLIYVYVIVYIHTILW
jgi:uncharacterized membrane protein